MGSLPTLLETYPVRASDFHKRQYSDGRKSRLTAQEATRTALQKTTGPLLEVGGPSRSGFIVIDNLRLPNGLIVSNFEPVDGASLTADVRNLPFVNRSLGGILMKGLTSTPEVLVAEGRGDGYPRNSRALRDAGNMAYLSYEAPRQNDYSAWSDPEIIGFSQRIALLREARRTIEPNGVLVIAGMSRGEIGLAEQLGFELQASTRHTIDHMPLATNYGEFLMTLVNLSTPAGIASQAPSPFAR